MKLILLTLIILINHTYANSKVFLKCLATEEKKYHSEKKSGALVNLNKKMISEFIQMSSSLDVKKRFDKQICSHPKFPPSYSLLYIILTHKNKAFVSYADAGDIPQRSQDKKTIQEVLNRSYFAFINYIDDLQAQGHKPNCLLDQSQELKDFYFKARYTLEDIGAHKLFSELKNLKQLFDNLIDPKFLAKCNSK